MTGDDLTPTKSTEEGIDRHANRSIASVALIIMLGNVVSRLLGFLRDTLTANYFGTSAQASGYFTAYRIQTSIYDLLISGVISAAFIPVFSSIRDDRDAFRRVGGTILSITLIVMVLAMAMLELFAHDVMILMTLHTSQPGILRSTGTSALHLIAPAVVFLGLSGVLMALLYAKQRAIFPALSPAIFNFMIVGAAVMFHQRLGVNSLVVGVLAGAVAQVVLQLYGLRGAGLRLSLAAADPRVRKIGRLALPVFIGLVITQMQVLLDAVLANSTGHAGLSYLTYATRIQQLPLGIVATAMSLASLPMLSRLTGREYRDTLVRGLNMTVVLIVPTVVVCGVLAGPLIKIAFQRHNFLAADVRPTAQALQFYTPGLLFAAVDQLLLFAFYAKNDTKTPVLVGVVSIGVYMLVAFPALPLLSFRGLALADSAKQLSHALILYILLTRWQGRLDGFGLRGVAGKAVAAGALMAVVCSVALRLIGTDWTTNTVLAIGLVVGVGGVATLGYGLILSIWGVTEIGELTGKVAKYARR